ncbi:MAG: hypothetical protein NTV59_07645 [Chloroflexi bacterium]|jgi:hypothetical protein|nr:hypothetical protein [Chloroflexota bacterium]
MVKVNLSPDVFQWLQSLAEPLVDTPNDVLRKLMLGRIMIPPPPSGPHTTFDNSPEPEGPDSLTKALSDQIVRDLQSKAGDSSIVVKWQPKGKRFSLLCNKGVFANIHPFQPRKKRVRVEVPGKLVAKANIAIKDFDKTWENGWYKIDKSYLINIPQNGGNWDASRYELAIDILIRVWSAR